MFVCRKNNNKLYIRLLTNQQNLQRVDRLETNEDTTGVITSHESKREQYNGIREKDKQ
jgi:hypothetical protein